VKTIEAIANEHRVEAGFAKALLQIISGLLFIFDN